MTTQQTYLVFSATGRQGRSVVKALAAKGETSIVCTSRDPTSTSSTKLLEMDGVTKVLTSDYNDTSSIVSAIKESGANRIWFTTDFWSIPFFKRTRATEAKLGSNVVDCIKQAKSEGCNIEHVVYSSVGDADNVSEKVGHFWGKADVEKYMASTFDKESGITWSVIRPVAFLENFDDAANYNPLTKGSLKLLTYPEKRTKFIACEDIGKGSAVLLTNPKEYAGRKIEAAGSEESGIEAAKALSEVSGVECKYTTTPPRFLLWLMMGDLYYMTIWMEEEGKGYTANIEEFKKLVPDAMDSKAFFESKGQWANGEKFNSSS